MGMLIYIFINQVKPRPHHSSQIPHTSIGFNNSFFAWSKQVQHFSQKADHAVLVFDNRGVGNSE